MQTLHGIPGTFDEFDHGLKLGLFLQTHPSPKTCLKTNKG
ncbi:hypothetical protein C943_02912 [Mariniradius saccharolyticus AK6]|uniref:Uncharacterized protein n=1 Tax=Mariniradius saccharolyticus AK6 TaxID=1239962 RepID=M7XC64_9BACT|nr:hypothetical protein C943_02912 [Mariniradius saccharolyticus AK6]